MKNDVTRIPSIYFETWMNILPQSTFLVFCYLHYLSCRKKTYIHQTTYEELAKAVNLSRQTVGRCCRQLSGRNLIRRKTFKKGRVTYTQLDLRGNNIKKKPLLALGRKRLKTS